MDQNGRACVVAQLLLPIGSLHILKAIEKFWFNSSTHRSHEETANQKSCYTCMAQSTQSAAVL